VSRQIPDWLEVELAGLCSSCELGPEVGERLAEIQQGRSKA